MNSRRTLLCLIAGLLTFVLAAPSAQADEKAELKKRFTARYPTLLKLKNAGKVGENLDGRVQVVKEAYAKEKTDPEDAKSPTIGDFLGLENQDRGRLYELIAEERKEKASDVARTNAVRNYNHAAPDHYLLIKDKQTGKRVWKQKKSL